MCDYSLEMYASRPAREGELYQTTRFPSGSLGLAAPGDCGTAVCVQYDTRLELDGLPASLRDALGVSARETVSFVRLEAGAYRDGVRFANGKEATLQQLGPGVRASMVPAPAEAEPVAALAHSLAKAPELV
ncbi:MAG: hypothetical protein JWN93_1482 [Hyphomicrobiales bacterium]|nr:hypothetical protein [Hyphomicrobiales bacterium]